MVLTAVLASSFLFAACTTAQQQMLEGVLQNVDSVSGTITVVDKSGKTHVINIQSNSQVQTQSGDSSLDALVAGTEVEIELEGGNVTRRIKADLARIQGTISQVNASTNETTITPVSGGTAVTLRITGDTRIRISGDRDGSFSNLTVGVRVDASYNTNTKVALRVSVGQTETADIEGRITNVSTNNVTIQTEKGRVVNLATNNSTLIRMRGTIMTMAALKAGLKVNAKFDPFTKLATRIEIQTQEGENDGDNRGKDEGRRVEANFRAHLSGDQEVPPVNTRAEGEAIFQLSQNGTMLSFKLNVSNTDNVQMAHIHLAAKGQNGGVVVWLYPSAPPAVKIPGRFDGVLATGNITAANLVGSLQGQPLSMLIEQLRRGTAYVNVHTDAYPSGEIRGQIFAGDEKSGDVEKSDNEGRGQGGETREQDSSNRGKS